MHRPPRSSESYLNIPQVISAAEIANVDAIHPGYGFLSENANFAEVCEASHITFIGPSPEVIRMMGEKDRARAGNGRGGAADDSGQHGDGGRRSHARKRIAAEIGFPVMIKAAEGGGGRGMRIVRTAAELIPAFQTARAEAEQAFGCGNVYMEKLIERPRHIEFQVMGDRHGNVMHLGERECSIQRRHQKVLEESPSTAVDAGDARADRQASGGRAEEGGIFERRDGGVSADESGNLYFIEMNARIQVEHPVTEMVTGVDLVKSQIRVAAGEKLADVVGKVEFRGHAIECRINAEDPETFMPSAGRIPAFRVPGGPGIRVDTARVYRWRDSAVLRFADGQGDRARARPRRSDRADEAARWTDWWSKGSTPPFRCTRGFLPDPDFVAGKVRHPFSGPLRDGGGEVAGGCGCSQRSTLILDAASVPPGRLMDIAQEILEAGVRLVQCRDKRASSRELFERSAGIGAAVARRGCGHDHLTIGRTSR